jgi:hypothetical protein
MRPASKAGGGTGETGMREEHLEWNIYPETSAKGNKYVTMVVLRDDGTYVGFRMDETTSLAFIERISSAHKLSFGKDERR